MDGGLLLWRGYPEVGLVARAQDLVPPEFEFIGPDDDPARAAGATIVGLPEPAWALAAARVIAPELRLAQHQRGRPLPVQEVAGRIGGWHAYRYEAASLADVPATARRVLVTRHDGLHEWALRRQLVAPDAEPIRHLRTTEPIGGHVIVGSLWPHLAHEGRLLVTPDLRLPAALRGRDLTYTEMLPYLATDEPLTLAITQLEAVAPGPRVLDHERAACIAYLLDAGRWTGVNLHELIDLHPPLGERYTRARVDLELLRETHGHLHRGSVAAATLTWPLLVILDLVNARCRLDTARVTDRLHETLDVRPPVVVVRPLEGPLRRAGVALVASGAALGRTLTVVTRVEATALARPR